MQTLALLAAAAAVVSPQPRLTDGAAEFRIRLADGVERVRREPLAPPARTAIGAYLTCRSGGTGVLYGTGGRGVAKVKAVLADGRRVTLRREAAPRRWSYRGAVFTRVVDVGVSILEVRGYDARGHRVTHRRYEPAEPCATARPPEPKSFDPEQVDPDIVTGHVAARLARAERAWRRARVDDYDVQVLVSCFCAAPANRWVTSRVRDGRRVDGSDWSVPALFTAIRKEIERRPASLAVSYGDRGIPTRIAVDGKLGLSDDEVTISTRRFRRR